MKIYEHRSTCEGKSFLCIFNTYKPEIGKSNIYYKEAKLTLALFDMFINNDS